MSLTKNNNPGFSWNDTQASTVAALGNAALLLGGKLLGYWVDSEVGNAMDKRLAGGNQEKALIVTLL